MVHKFSIRSGLAGRLLVPALVVGGLMVPFLVSAAPGDAAKGEEIFKQKCGACHTVGGGRTIGPDLKEVTTRRDRAWLTRFIIEPDKVLAAKDPVAVALLQEYNNIPMPNMGLSKEDVEDVLVFLESKSTPATTPAPPTTATPPPPTTAPPLPSTATVTPVPSPTTVTPPPSPTAPPLSPSPTPAAPPGDPVTGKNLFTGLTPLQNGGAPCLACHNIAGLGNLKGGTLAPDLTATFSKYGDAGTATILTTLPFPVMKPLYGNQPLTPEEVANLKAFLKQTTVAQPAPVTGRLVIYILIGLAVLLLLVQIIWRRRLPEVRKSLLLLR